MQDFILYLVPAIALLGLAYMLVQSRWVKAQDAGDDRMVEIARSTSTKGALAFLSAEYRILAIFVVVAGALLGRRVRDLVPKPPTGSS